MPRRAPFAVLLCLCSAAILSSPATAITLKRHVLIPHGVTRQDDQHRVVVTTVAPPDSDDDGCPNDQDSYSGPGCSAPAPTVAAQPSVSVAPSAPATSTVAPSAAGGCPSYMAAEATSPDAVNPSSGAAGCFQVLPSTQAAMGAACSDVNSSSCVGAICAAEGNAAWASSGSTPCDYVKP